MSSVEVAYSIVGAGPPLYMVHGIGSRKATWEALIKDLRTDFTCVSFDLRGHGESPVPPVPYSLDELVEDLEALRQRLGHQRIHVVGHSLGGQIGPAYARPSECVETVGLLSTAAGRTSEDSAKVKAVVAMMREKGVKPLLKTLIKRWFTDEFMANSPDAVEARVKQVVETPEEVFLNVFDIYADTEMLPWLPRLECPCLVMTGELDAGCSPVLNKLIADTLPNAELVILEKLKHSILIEAPEKVLPPLRDFLIRHC
ncbi:MAG: 3-oxoadipate enol-lactone hydrolase [Pseudomonadota bacterium]|nr:MAG: 3-oxoadipate enol-lactone hydrolase [Pseudomonadota bacterium]